MNDKDFQFIESRLDVELPEVFKKFMRQFPNDASQRLQGDLGTIESNAELFVIEQLKRFAEHGHDYYELQPHLRDHRFMDIGGDGCGNFYCMVGNHRKSNDLWMWEHDPYDGLTRCENTTLGEYFSEQWDLVPREDPFASIPAGQTIVCRASHPHRSLLDPISMAEWLGYIADHKVLSLDEEREVPNPFTDQTLVVRQWPGRARVGGDPASYIYYLDGMLALSSQVENQDHQKLLRNIAQDLRAQLF
ncbi:MAG: SMI1/KNR4 family protein [Pirellulales bacterium]|nr:SMI1/KNR4 family protein [Planctomycetales bacterium]